MDKEAYAKYHRAEQRVKALKGFYRHLQVFVVVTLLIFFVRFYLLPMLGVISQDERFVDWLDVNTYLVPGIWAIAVLIHGLAVHKIKWISNWEQRKLREFLEEDDTSGA